MSPKDVKEILDKIFSEEGFEIKGFKIKSKTPLVANIHHDGGRIDIKFGSNLPKAEITRIITVYAYIEQVVLGETGASIKLRSFPDITLNYENFSEIDPSFVFNFSSLEETIDKKYSESSHKQIAKKCLQYAEEWATICHQSGVTFENADYADRYVMYNQCYDFVKENIEKDVEKRYGSVILTWLFAYVILPMIIKWIVNKVLERLFND
tara:strand:+ start:14586 stop:15212 length:627 start_codon:yes stop_codon:yes gene_type:complete